MSIHNQSMPIAEKEKEKRQCFALPLLSFPQTTKTHLKQGQRRHSRAAS